MPRLPHGEILELDPDIERTYKQSRIVQKASSASTSSDMANQPPPPPPLNDAEKIIKLANSKDGGIMDYAIPVFDQLNSWTVKPKIEALRFELKPVMFQMLQTNGQFSGLPSEDPHSHLNFFMEITDTFRISGVYNDAIRVCLFLNYFHLKTLKSDSVRLCEFQIVCCFQVFREILVWNWSEKKSGDLISEIALMLYSSLLLVSLKSFPRRLSSSIWKSISTRIEIRSNRSPGMLISPPSSFLFDW